MLSLVRFPVVSCVITFHSRVLRAPSSCSCVVRALFPACRALSACCFAHVARAVSHVASAVSQAACRTLFTSDNKLFLLIITHVDNIN
jgi:hypothetical protein